MRVAQGLALAALGCAALLGGGSRPSEHAQGGGMAGAPANDATLAPGVTSLGDRDRGRQIFTTNGATCHGATGIEGGVGPSLLKVPTAGLG